MLRLEEQGFLIGSKRLVDEALRRECDGQVVVGIGHVRQEPDRLAATRLGLIRPAKQGQGVCEVAVQQGLTAGPTAFW